MAPNTAPSSDAALVSAMTTEHFVLQSAIGSTYTEASARSSLYVMALSSSLVAIGFLADKPRVLMPFIAIVLPTLFVLGLFTIIRLVETSLENMHYLHGIAHIRKYYRGLSDEAARHFTSERGRWPEVVSPAERLGSILAFLGTTATMIAAINSAVAGVGVTVLVLVLVTSAPLWLAACCGVATTVVLSILFYRFQRWRFAEDDDARLAASHH